MKLRYCKKNSSLSCIQSKSKKLRKLSCPPSTSILPVMNSPICFTHPVSCNNRCIAKISAEVPIFVDLLPSTKVNVIMEHPQCIKAINRMTEMHKNEYEIAVLILTLCYKYKIFGQSDNNTDFHVLQLIISILFNQSFTIQPIFLFDNPGLVAFDEKEQLRSSTHLLFLTMINHGIDEAIFEPSFVKRLVKASCLLSYSTRSSYNRLLLTFYNSYPSKQIEILNSIFYELDSCRLGFNLPMSIMPLLSFLNEIKSRNCEMSIIRNHVNSCLIPFLSSPHLVCFFNELFSLLDYYSSISRNTSISIIEYLIHTFPISNLSKQGLYVKLMNSIVFRLSVSSFHEYCSRIFHFYCRCLESFHVQSIESFYDLVEDGYIKNRIVDKSSLLTSILMSSIERLSSIHWNQSIRNRSFQFIKFMKLIDTHIASTEKNDDLIKMCLRKHEWKIITQEAEKNSSLL